MPAGRDPDQRAKEDKSGGSAWRDFARYSDIAVTLPAAVLIGFGSGYLLDQRFHTGKVFEIVLLFVGFAAGMIQVYRVINRP